MQLRSSDPHALPDLQDARSHRHRRRRRDRRARRIRDRHADSRTRHLHTTDRVVPHHDEDPPPRRLTIDDPHTVGRTQVGDRDPLTLGRRERHEPHRRRRRRPARTRVHPAVPRRRHHQPHRERRTPRRIRSDCATALQPAPRPWHSRQRAADKRRRARASRQSLTTAPHLVRQRVDAQRHNSTTGIHRRRDAAYADRSASTAARGMSSTSRPSAPRRPTAVHVESSNCSDSTHSRTRAWRCRPPHPLSRPR